MANRSKKAMLSARVDPYLKVGLDLLAESRGVKTVKVLETILENGLSDAMVRCDLKPGEKLLSFMLVLTAIWSDDEAILRLRAGELGPPVANERTWKISSVIREEGCFRGDDDLFGDMNGTAEKYGLVPPTCPKLNLDRVRSEWEMVGDYVDFLENNKPIEPTYEQYKAMRAKGEAKG